MNLCEHCIKGVTHEGTPKEYTRPSLDKVINALKAEGITTLGATGYCFGGRYVFDLAFENIIKVGVISHPSHLIVPDDLEKYVATSQAPLLINSCTTDLQFPLEACAKADKIFANFAPGYKREHFKGLTHGFAKRARSRQPLNGSFPSSEGVDLR
ncbi:hypothetical protein BDN70DRAFT_916925 [Pholiota conissans]|uniref:Dienelactone hydrolase domain-containing protein n=1 Tax=Pholiota conissans TaxID=109636 RepID=A0A9P5ZCH1_9AGAR|nr:hypothetical protein BDN70DRAFT_916925 [Pholiota conissans]